jgi:hypothetical protein
MVWRIFGGLSAILAGLAVRKVLVKGWHLATGNEPPSNPAHPETRLPHAIAWALVTGALVGLARMLATRKAADYYRRSAGHLPADMEEVT